MGLKIGNQQSCAWLIANSNKLDENCGYPKLWKETTSRHARWSLVGSASGTLKSRKHMDCAIRAYGVKLISVAPSMFNGEVLPCWTRVDDGIITGLDGRKQIGSHWEFQSDISQLTSIWLEFNLIEPHWKPHWKPLLKHILSEWSNLLVFCSPGEVMAAALGSWAGGCSELGTSFRGKTRIFPDVFLNG